MNAVALAIVLAAIITALIPWWSNQRLITQFEGALKDLLLALRSQFALRTGSAEHSPTIVHATKPAPSARDLITLCAVPIALLRSLRLAKRISQADESRIVTALCEAIGALDGAPHEHDDYPTITAAHKLIDLIAKLDPTDSATNAWTEIANALHSATHVASMLGSAATAPWLETAILNVIDAIGVSKLGSN